MWHLTFLPPLGGLHGTCNIQIKTLNDISGPVHVQHRYELLVLCVQSAEEAALVLTSLFSSPFSSGAGQPLHKIFSLHLIKLVC